MASYAAVALSPQKLRDQADNTGRTGHQRYVAFRTIRERITEEIGGSVVAEANSSTFTSSKSPLTRLYFRGSTIKQTPLPCLSLTLCPFRILHFCSLEISTFKMGML